ncbi:MULTISPECIES: DUF2336 domain-containing protein [unclassified Sinorhizobium]|uniref:DUF2336 domain-containing protein n=1 Tax=unclassified Sinorhizobium TaxID=2613772 RepID=UPI0024C32639|nr:MULTISPECIES: DUF2336 domain-containing protein [unclassified Sinorhizobium]MDK1375590.1 DUF2336 domain-containing protein [Sinorhizobium sp. 6-70]MDK1479483.1 DUF2336 domain-containing protein [Sinorhizobium sp. 6-117]
MFCVQGQIVTNRFRELERPQTGRLKDVVLMATVTGFESLRIPRKSDMKQFAELFEPLFLGSSDEARRQATAALSQCAHVPEPVALLIGSMPIAIAATFLTRSKAISDRVLISIIRRQGAAHASAIAHRENLSPSVVDALVEHHQAVYPNGQLGASQPRADAASPSPPAGDSTSSDRIAREDKLREEIKALVRAEPREGTSRIRPIDELHQALLMRFARSGEAVLFASTLADALRSSRALAERILLDISGQQLTVTLSALEFPNDEMNSLLEALYPHLSERLGGGTRATAMIETVARKASVERVEAWLRADEHGAPDPARYEAHLADNRASDPRQQEARPAVAHRSTAQPMRGLGRR